MVTVGKLGILGSCASVVFSLTCVIAAQAQSLSAEFSAAARSTPLFSAHQIVDRPPVATPGRSIWGVVAGVTPQWWVPDAWKETLVEDATTLEGRELRIGIRRGRPLGYEFGFSYVRKSMTRFLFEEDNLSTTLPGDTTPLISRDAWTPIETVQIPGVEYHSFIPTGKIGSRVQLGALLGVGAGYVPSTSVRRRIVGPPYFATSDNFTPLRTLPATGGFVWDGHTGNYVPVLPGQTGAELTDSVREMWDANVLLLIRAHIAADVLVAPPFKLRFSGGFNYPGAERLSIEAVYLFGAGR